MNSLYVLLNAAFRELEQTLGEQIAQVLGEKGLGSLNAIQYYVLQALCQHDGQTATSLARAVERAATSFTPILDDLEAGGYLERRKHPKDRRAILLHITDKGRAVMKAFDADAFVGEYDLQSLQALLAQVRQLKG